jgi:hypothetical protein
VPSLLRHRRATVAVAALLASTPPLVSAVAVAEPAAAPNAPAQKSDREIVFTGGGSFHVRCTATPVVASVTVPPENTLRVVNNTGRRARLMLDGLAQGEISEGSAGEVLFHRGPVSLALKPMCLSVAASPVRVEVATPASPVPGTTGPAGVGPVSSAGVSRVPPGGRADGPAAEPTTSVQPLSRGGPIGLLALTAAICVVGVSAGAIRAIMAQRTTKTIVA